MRWVLPVIIVALLTGCQPKRLGFWSSPELVTHNASDSRRIARAVEGGSFGNARPINLADYPFFNEGSFGQEWLAGGRHRAIAIGYPTKECGTYNYRIGHGSLFQAVERTMEQCLSRVRELGKHLGRSCACRLGAVDNTVFLAPEEFPFRKTLPAVALVKDSKGRREILGYAKTTGRTGQNQPFEFYTQSDQKVCHGAYTLGRLSTTGEAQLNCFNNQISGPAVFKVAGFHEGQAFGTALVKAGENELLLVYGLPNEEFQKRRAELVGQ